MQQGSIIKCINDNFEEKNSLYGEVLPVRNEIYVVRDILLKGECLHLEEIINPPGYYFHPEVGAVVLAECGFNVIRFVELLPPMEISIESLIEEEMYV
jgi:hypothetical protein